MTEPLPVYIETIEELTAHLREEAGAGNIPNVLCLLDIAKDDLGGPEAADRLYADIVRPTLKGRWDAWLHDEPGAPELTDDELRMMCGLAIESLIPEEDELGRRRAMAALRKGWDERKGSPGPSGQSQGRPSLRLIQGDGEGTGRLF